MKRKMNVRLLRRIQKHILAEPLRYNQNITIEKGKPGQSYREDTNFKQGTLPKCGTTACIGGWALSLSFGARVFNFTRARRVLGISTEEAEKLFSYTWDNSWPTKFKVAYNKAKTPRQRARIAFNRIEHFIKTRE